MVSFMGWGMSSMFEMGTLADWEITINEGIFSLNLLCLWPGAARMDLIQFLSCFFAFIICYLVSWSTTAATSLFVISLHLAKFYASLLAWNLLSLIGCISMCLLAGLAGGWSISNDLVRNFEKHLVNIAPSLCRCFKEFETIFFC